MPGDGLHLAAPHQRSAPTRDESVQRLLDDWEWIAQALNRTNRSMGHGDLYPFTLVAPVRRKLSFIHDLVIRAPLDPNAQIAIATAVSVDPERA
ncbi:putative zinc-binding metallopeptidase [Microbacterium aurantiacum]|uniref:putative zinc-binding metallopeptidase n=1 Tax=Microbacterium aurantiacum TaxID=162393 RepID=UPI003F490B53